MPEQDHENADRGDLPDLGLRAYATDEHSNGDLRREPRRAPRPPVLGGYSRTRRDGPRWRSSFRTTRCSADLQVTMAVDTSSMEVYPDVRERDDSSWVCDSFTERWSLGRIEEPCPDCEIVAVLERNIMDPETAEVLAVLDAAGQEPFAVNIHHDECGRTEFFEL